MSIELLANAIVSFLALAFLCYLVFQSYQQYRVDRFRHNIFIMRDELFDKAAEGFIPFDHEAYRLVRTLMNGYIRYAHRLSLLDPLFMWAFERIRGPLPSPISFNALYTQVTRDLTREQKALLDDYLTQVNSLVIRHVTKALPEIFVFALVSLIVGLFVLCEKVFARTRQSLNLEEALEHRVADMAFTLGSNYPSRFRRAA